MKEINLVFPHQLFEKNPLLSDKRTNWLVEEYLFFRQYAFHRQKLVFHRSSMQYYQSWLRDHDHAVRYVHATDAESDIRKLVPALQKEGVEKMHYIDPTDNWLEKRLVQAAEKANIELVRYDSPLFLNAKPREDFFKPAKKRYFQTEYYTAERKDRELLLEKDGSPLGGKWSFDSDNRKKYPKKNQAPEVYFPKTDDFYEEAVNYVHKHFADNPGETDTCYPHTHRRAKEWLKRFLEQRFGEFGTYEDAIVREESILHHGLLSPMLNVGLLTPDEVLEAALDQASESDIPLNSLEGFVRQIVGWREFIRGVYELKGTQQRTRNYWNFKRKIPKSFYDGTTGILPLDETIRKVLKTGYCHHIERLMILGNCMLLHEFDPDEVYRWFMELFIDSYDWVMVPNIYGMTQFADGGIMTTKPYVSGSNYILKMSDYPKGDWQETWDALFWRFMDKHREFFEQNPRLGMLLGTLDKMKAEKRKHLFSVADEYLKKLPAN